MTVASEGSPALAEELHAVVSETREFLEVQGSMDHSAGILGQVQRYFRASDLFAAEVSVDDSDRFIPTADRERLLWAAVADLLVFRCIGMVDCWAAVNDIYADQSISVEDRDEFRPVLSAALSEVLEAEGLFNQHGGSVATGGAGNDLRLAVQLKARRIADESASSVLSAVLDVPGGPVLSAVSNMAMRVLHRFGRARRLRSLLDWAQRMLDLALAKLRRVFGPGFDVIVEHVRPLVEKIAMARDKLADGLFQIPGLLKRCEEEILRISDQEADGRLDDLNKISARFDRWNLGLDVAAVSLKWGWRIAAIAPPVGLAVAALRGALASGAFLIGRDHLDSPELAFLPLGTDGILSVLQGKGSAASPEVAGPAQPRGFGDEGF